MKGLKVIDGPPFASGKIHYGTLYNKYLKTIYSRLNGKSSFKFFFDTHGLPIENKLPKDSPWTSYYDLSKKNSEIMINDFSLYGIEGETTELTCDLNYCKHIWTSFKKLHDKKLVYQKNKILLFCPSCSSICSNNELVVNEVATKSCYYKFPVANSSFSLLVYTTQPWTLEYNEGIAYNPEVDYLVSTQGLIASRFYFEKNNLIGTLVDLSRLTYLNKTLKKTIPSILVDVNIGTGLVHLAPNYGLLDSELLESTEEVDLNYDGTFKSHNLNYKELSEKYLLEENCYQVVEIIHKDQCCWRCNTPCLRKKIFTIFLKTKDYKDVVLSWINSKTLSIFPQVLCNKFLTWINNIEDWGVARQRKWGVQIPIWRNKENKELKTFSIKEYCKLTNSFCDLSLFHTPLKSVFFKNKEYVPTNQILDVWFDSACLSSYLKKDNNVAIESIDQVRGWFYGSCILNAMLGLNPPWIKTYCHGYLLKNQKEKFSKSTNQIDLSSLDQKERERLLFYLSNRSPWKNTVFDINESKKTNKVLNILNNLSKVPAGVNTINLLERNKLEKIINWFCLLKEDFQNFSSNILVAYILDFSRYVNKNKGLLNKNFLGLVILIVKKIVDFFMLKNKNYEKIKKEIIEKYDNFIIDNVQ